MSGKVKPAISDDVDASDSKASDILEEIDRDAPRERRRPVAPTPKGVSLLRRSLEPLSAPSN